MKTTSVILLLLFLMKGWGGLAETTAEPRFYLFSKQNYYTSEKEAVVVCVTSGNNALRALSRVS